MGIASFVDLLLPILSTWKMLLILNFRKVCFSPHLISSLLFLFFNFFFLIYLACKKAEKSSFLLERFYTSFIYEDYVELFVEELKGIKNKDESSLQEFFEGFGGDSYLFFFFFLFSFDFLDLSVLVAWFLAQMTFFFFLFFLFFSSWALSSFCGFGSQPTCAATQKTMNPSFLQLFWTSRHIALPRWRQWGRKQRSFILLPCADFLKWMQGLLTWTNRPQKRSTFMNIIFLKVP